MKITPRLPPPPPPPPLLELDSLSIIVSVKVPLLLSMTAVPTGIGEGECNRSVTVCDGIVYDFDIDDLLCLTTGELQGSSGYVVVSTRYCIRGACR